MIYALSAFAVFMSFWAAFQLQIITFIPALGLWSIHKFEPKRWVLRLTSIAMLIWLWLSVPLSCGIVAVLSTGAALLALSLFNDNTAGFRALNPDEIDHLSGQVLEEDDIVVGIEMPDGTAVCYPLNQMVIPRHLVNDTISGLPRLVSYCAACRSCMVYYPVIDDQHLTFQVVAVKNRNMVIRDRETGSLWQQGTGEAIYGALKGRQLSFFDAQQMKYVDWLARHPKGLSAQEKPGTPKGRIPKKALMRMLKITNILMTPGKTEIGTELPLREKVFGLSLNGYDKAYPVSELVKQPVFQDNLGRETIQISYNPKTNEISAALVKSGRLLVLQNHWWFGWKEFHPETLIWRAD